MATVEFLGQLSDICGRSHDVTLPNAVPDVASLRSWLNERFDGNPLAPASIRAIVNGEVAADQHRISNADRIAFFPPVGGG
jgi:molybdopterin converting factor small subunit